MEIIMTPEEKAKAYDEAFERAKKLQENSILKKWLLHIFPELKENEDERIRKLLISGMKHLTYTAETFASIPIKDVIDWLEKQGEQKPTDKVEPKFKVGDWIVSKTSNLVYCVDSILFPQSKCYCLSYNGGTVLVNFSDEQNYRLWTIQDAKDGDTLVASDGSLFMFAKLKNNSAYYHISLCKNGSMEISDGNHSWETAKGCHPATKEQCDLLFQKMKEARYMWDYEKKELKKIENASNNEAHQKLGGFINELSKQFPEVSFAKLSRIAVRVAKWVRQNK
jgi:hypothetical protein